MPFYPALLSCAYTELEVALNDRKRNVVRNRNNHLTEHAVGSIALLVDGLEAWLNHVLFRIGTHNETPGSKNPRNIASISDLRDRYSALSEYVTGTKPSVPQRLDLTIQLRNEIVHHLPMWDTTNTPNVPNWFNGLEKKGLFVTSKHRQPDLVDFGFSLKLQSYSLAYWAWESVDQAVTHLIAPWPSYVGGWDKEAGMEDFYFKRYKTVCPPEALPQFDAIHGLGNDDPA